jgi:hypothetical protein
MYNYMINFDEASRVWRLNKKHLGNGIYAYKCIHFSHTKNKFCPKICKPGSDYCRFHGKATTLRKNAT